MGSILCVIYNAAGWTKCCWIKFSTREKDGSYDVVVITIPRGMNVGLPFASNCNCGCPGSGVKMVFFTGSILFVVVVVVEVVVDVVVVGFGKVGRIGKIGKFVAAVVD